MRVLALTTALAGLLAAGPASAGPSITLNGIAIDGVTDQKFENATVVVDGAGNVHITARGYAVKGGAAAPQTAAAAAAPPAGGPAAPSGPAAQPARLTKRYFLATEQSQTDGTQYDVEVFINSSWIRVLRSSDSAWVGEITRYLKPGPNLITLAATKKLAGVTRRHYTSDVTMRVVIGEGNVGGDHVMIDQPLVVMTRTAAEVDDKTEEHTVEAR